MFAPENFTANATLASDYRFRGISNSDGFAMQGGFDWAFQGFSAGVWGSNTEFSDSNIEVDIYGGYGWTMSGIDMHVNLLYYMFPGESSRETEGLDPPGFDPSTGLRRVTLARVSRRRRLDKSSPISASSRTSTPTTSKSTSVWRSPSRV